MTDAAFDTIGAVLWGILRLNPEAFQAIRQFPAEQIDTLALAVVFLAGFSQAVAQSIILFMNRVKPLRFMISLGLAALLFVAGYLFWAASIWLAGQWFLDDPISWQTVADSLAFSYLPLVFSFLGAMPYFGVPILRLLSVWNLLAVVVGFSILAGLSAGQVLWHVGLGWVVLQVLQQTVGQPIVNLGRWLTNRVAGVTLVVNRRELAALVSPERLQPPGSPLAQGIRSSKPGGLTSGEVAVVAPPANDRSEDLPELTQPLPPTLSVAKAREGPGIERAGLAEPRATRWVRRMRQYGGILALTLVVMTVLTLLRQFLPGWYGPARPLLRLIVDLAWIGVLALVIGALLAPLEALGWWAGWYGDTVQTVSPAESGLDPWLEPSTFNRYVVYLDGVNQATPDYQPAVSQYLNELEQSLPNDIALVKGLLPYSVLNRSLTQDRPLAFFWRWIEWLSEDNIPLVGVVINLRNILIVAVSADSRYGPIYNQGIAQQAYEGLLRAGYPLGGGVPITLIGYSGGGQIAMGIMPFLRQALVAPIEVVSLGGVISGNVRALEGEQFYHLAGKKDRVERLGPIMFPRRWPVAFLSYWNRAKRQGKISFIPLGPVGHQVPGGIVDPNAFLPDGRSHLQQTLDLTLEILVGDLRRLLNIQKTEVLNPGNYYLYRQAAFNRPDGYPIPQTLDDPLFLPVGNWMGRLILPELEQRCSPAEVWIELWHTPPDYRQWLGKRVPLRWQDTDRLKKWMQFVTRDVHFSADAEYSHRQGLVVPTRLNHWRYVSPLESIAGARPADDFIVKLVGPVRVEASPTHPITLVVTYEPVQVSGLYYALVQFVGPQDEALERYQVRHYNRDRQRFDGPEATVLMPAVVSDVNGVEAFTNRGIEHSPPNQTGWYIYGAQNHQGEFVVQALLPRCLVQLAPNQFIANAQQGRRYLQKEAWADLPKHKNTVASVLISPAAATEQAAIAQWQEGDQALLSHVYGGIGGNKREPAAKGPIYFGHFSYGIATVVREPLAHELQFDITYHQVYTHNPRGLIAGSLHWSHYMGDRQWGFLGTRPVVDVLIKLPAYTQPFGFGDQSWSALDDLRIELEAMTARYRIGDGTGVTYVGPANNCAQDSMQAMYASLKHLEVAVAAHRAKIQAWEQAHPAQARQFEQLLKLRRAIQRGLLPFGSARADWEGEQALLGSSIQDFPLTTLGRGLLSWRTMLPRKASDTITDICLQHGASIWVLRTNQVGGYDPDIEPIAPFTL
ncbi:MAG: Yip1 family protein [Nodosilinea sp.]